MQEIINKSKFKTTIVGMGEDFEKQYREIEVVPFEFANSLMAEVNRLKTLVEEIHIEAGKLEKERNEAIAENEMIKEMVGWIQCAACGQKFRAKDFDMLAHIHECKDHPIYKLMKENLILKKQNSRQLKLIKTMRTCLLGDEIVENE